MPSNFTSGEPYAAKLNYQEPPVINVCATQGAGFLHRLYVALGVDPMLSWGSELQSALIAKASFLRSQAPAEEQAQWLPLIRALQSDLASTRTSRAGHVFGLYVTYYLPFNHRLDAISLPPGTILMQWGVPPLDDGGLNDGALVCIDPAHDPAFLTVNATDVAESVTGIRTGESRPVPPDQRTLPNAAVIGAGGLFVIAAVGAVAWWWFGRDARANPTLTREKIDGLRICWKRCEEDATGRESRE